MHACIYTYMYIYTYTYTHILSYVSICNIDNTGYIYLCNTYVSINVSITYIYVI